MKRKNIFQEKKTLDDRVFEQFLFNRVVTIIVSDKICHNRVMAVQLSDDGGLMKTRPLQLLSGIISNFDRRLNFL